MSKKKRGKQRSWLEKQRAKTLARQTGQQLQTPSPASPTVRQSTGGIARVQQQTQIWNSPTLPPQVIAEYANLLPDAPERFFKYMEREQENRHEQQAIVLRQVSRTQIFVFSLSALGLIIAAVCAITGTAAGLVIAVPALLPLVVAVWQQYQDKKEERAASKTLPPGTE